MSTTTHRTPTQASALHALARSGHATPATLGTGWYVHDARGILVQISSTTASVLEHDGLVQRQGKPVRLVLTEAGRAWVGENA